MHTMFEKKDKKRSLIQYICSFSKTGGSIIYGITESKTTSKIYRAEGINFLLLKKYESEIEDHCRSKIKTTTLWLTHEGKILETDKIDAYICFIFHPMKCMGVKQKYKILEIAVAPFHGIVFNSISGPEAWRVDPKSSQINRIETVDWYRCLRKHLLEDDSILLSKKLSKLTIKRASIRDVHVFELENSIAQIQKKVFKRDVDLCFMPDVLIENLCESHKKFKNTLIGIKKFYSGETGVVVSDRKFLSVLNKNCEHISVCKSCHLCDFLIIGGDKPTVFLSIVALNKLKSHSMCKQNIKQYCHQSAKMVKLTLAQYTNIHFAICQGLMDIEHDNVTTRLEIILQQYDYYTETFKPTHQSLVRRRIFEICKALTLRQALYIVISI
ncbi:hypothetical protein KUTeg_006754 [Tegillarca granosa]|uniref:Uncharacterized protein n=1 Tax=Tegillarca granosa TaxID=220873 RepID=A0ABQ9FB79_TEGGR|nr:hypothetical protein KUTeg_006754 [Tegillarca granosa]